MLIVQNFGTNAPPDPYVVAQANKYLTGVLTQVISSNAFYEQTLASGFNFDRTFFSGDAASQLNQWQKSVEAYAADDTGIIDIRVYHPDKYQAEQLAQAVVYTLKEKHALYHSSGDKVSLKVLDQPRVSDYPVRPNLMLTFGSALLLGFAFGLFYIYVFSYSTESFFTSNQNFNTPLPTRNLQPIEPFEAEPASPASSAGKPSLQQTPVYQPGIANNNRAYPVYAYEEEQLSVSQDQLIGHGDMRNVFGYKGL